MKRVTNATIPLALIGLLVLVGAAADKPGKPGQRDVSQTPSTPIELSEPAQPEAQPGPTTAAAAAYSVDWYVISSGGVLGATSTNWSLDATVGQPLAGSGSSTNYTLEVGFWYGEGGAACAVGLTGDADNNGEVKLSDVIVLVNYVLKAGPDPVPCPAAGDVTCDAEVKLSDVIYLVNYVLKAGPAPCNVCDIIPSLWSCP